MQFTAMTGRVAEYEDDLARGVEREKMVFPSSCTLYVYDNNLQELLRFVSGALRKGAGVKVQLENFVSTGRQLLPDWFFLFDSNHPDFEKLESLPNEVKLQHLPTNLFNSLFLNYPGEDRPYRIIKVADSMTEDGEGTVSIERSWAEFVYCLNLGVSPIVDLSLLRAAGTPSSNRLVATGALGSGDRTDVEGGAFVSMYHRLYNLVGRGDIISLMQVLGQLNRTIRQGRQRKTGIVCTGLHYKHPDIKQYLRYPLESLVGSQKKAVRIDEGILEYPELVEMIVTAVNEQSVFLEKINPDEQLYSNVCEEILLKHRSTCLLSHVHGGALTKPSDIVTALVETTEYVVGHYLTWRDRVGSQANLFLPIEEDRQIGVGWIGFANYLAYEGVTYAEFVSELSSLLDWVEDGGDIEDWNPTVYEATTAQEIAYYLYIGYHKAAQIADFFGIERAFTMAPTQTVAYRYKDMNGKTCCRAIDPPFTRRVRRDSQRIGSEWHDHGQVELADSVGVGVHNKLWEQWQRLMETTGKAHTMSFDHWQKIDAEWLTDFFSSPLQTTYYNFADKLDQSYLNKGQALTATEAPKSIDCACAE